MKPEPTVISIVTDSSVFCLGLMQFLRQDCGYDGELIHQDIEAAAASIRAGELDILIIDEAATPRVEEVRKLGVLLPRVILTSERDHAGTNLELIKSSVCSLYGARWSEQSLVDQFKIIHQCPVPRKLASPICAACPLDNTWRPQELPLTPRELAVFKRIGDGLHPTEMAGELGISIKTVEAHQSNIRYKLGLESSAKLRMQAARWRQGRLISVPEPDHSRG
ncbi:MAG: LuxR C-terminal-related transcriptional regulator [Wenzhouxiangellaceae bacterium]|nr:LuxR C-terminal-related transcriptional regulator [Wenzhouxiangellaceae bacterium]